MLSRHQIDIGCPLFLKFQKNLCQPFFADLFFQDHRKKAPGSGRKYSPENSRKKIPFRSLLFRKCRVLPTYEVLLFPHGARNFPHRLLFCRKDDPHGTLSDKAYSFDKARSSSFHLLLFYTIFPNSKADIRNLLSLPAHKRSRFAPAFKL